MNLHQIILQPTDVLFFRDGRPMTGSLTGHSAAWPLPDVTNHALHAALHRAGLSGVHGHDHHSPDGKRVTDARKFGSLLTVGPFPVREEKGQQTWFFPRPRDTQVNGSLAVTFRPVRSLTGRNDDPWALSSLAAPLKYAVANTLPPAKDIGAAAWISADAFHASLRPSQSFPAENAHAHFLQDTDIADTEESIGIGIDPETQTQDKTNFYSAHYIRLREQFRLGLFAEAMDKLNGDPGNKRDLIKELLNGQPQSIIVGGQQRLCTAHRDTPPQGGLPLPRGLRNGFETHGEGPAKRWLVKWILLSPALWPEIPSMKKDGTPQNAHPGGWLPNWIFLDWDTKARLAHSNERNGAVLLTSGPGLRKAARKKSESGARLSARLVAALVPKAIIVTGWALPNDAESSSSGAKSTHLAVPAGAVYYFEADSESDAAALANALNWHGATDGTEIKNRRSTLMGEKGYGLGVCGTWSFYGQK